MKNTICVVCVGICALILLLPDSRTPENLRRWFSDRDLELIAFDPLTSGCSRMGGVRYEARTPGGALQRGVLCINKSMMFGHLQK